MIDDPARRGDLPEGLSFMTFLPARRLVRWLAQTLDPRRLFQPVTRRRLAAIRAVQSEPALKFSDMRFQSRDLGRLRRDQRNQLFPRWLGWRSRIHRILESNPDSDVQKNLRARLRQTAYPTWAETLSFDQRSLISPRESTPYAVMPMPSVRQVGNIDVSMFREKSEYSICRSQIGWTEAARRIVSLPTSEKPIWPK